MIGGVALATLPFLFLNAAPELEQTEQNQINRERATLLAQSNQGSMANPIARHNQVT
ncbi:MAG: hypothetical protein RLZZ511_3595 [Cyanobacteriota bacterium]|jgi:hypothetical protein